MRTASEPDLEIAFILDVAPIDRNDAERTMRKIQQAVKELEDDGVQIAPLVGMVIRDARQQVLDILPDSLR